MSHGMKIFYNGTSFPRSEIPQADNDAFFQGLLDASSAGWRVCSYFGVPHAGGADLYCIMSARGSSGELGIFSTTVGGAFPSLALSCPQLHLFEREIAEQCLVRPEGHPWLSLIHI